MTENKTIVTNSLLTKYIQYSIKFGICLFALLAIIADINIVRFIISLSSNFAAMISISVLTVFAHLIGFIWLSYQYYFHKRLKAISVDNSGVYFDDEFIKWECVKQVEFKELPFRRFNLNYKTGRQFSTIIGIYGIFFPSWHEPFDKIVKYLDESKIKFSII